MAELNRFRDVFPEDQRAIYAAAGYGHKAGLGQRPALLVIDVTYGFVGREPLPIRESMRTYPNSCGLVGWNAVRSLEQLIPQSRALEWPIFYTAGKSDNMVHHAGRWRDKHPRTLDQPEDANEVVHSVRPQVGDILIEKTKPSAFFGTPLAASLIDLRIDTLLVTGGTTSGCVRATIVDAFSYGFAVAVVEDAVFDRAQLSHDVTLFEMSQKYADVMSLGEVIKYGDAVHK